MSTRGIIARVGEHEGTFKGVYNHSDSYPTWMGPHLFEMLHETYGGNLKQMLKDIIDKHSAGWSSVGTECYCHPKRKRDAEPRENWFTSENFDERNTDIEWLWVFDEENMKLYVRDVYHQTDAGIVDLTAPQPDWTPIECGEELGPLSRNGKGRKQ